MISQSGFSTRNRLNRKIQGKGKPREDQMFQNSVLCLIAVVLFLICFKLFFSKSKENREKATRKKWLKENTNTTICQAICDYAYRHGESTVHRKFGVISADVIGVQTDIYAFLKSRVLPELKKYQHFFDQVLKMYAEDLAQTYGIEQHFRKENEKAFKQPNSLSRKEIEEFSHQERRSTEKKRWAERKFWELHDTLKELGLDTWGHKGHKVYLALSPCSISETLAFRQPAKQ